MTDLFLKYKDGISFMWLSKYFTEVYNHKLNSNLFKHFHRCYCYCRPIDVSYMLLRK